VTESALSQSTTCDPKCQVPQTARKSGRDDSRSARAEKQDKREIGEKTNLKLDGTNIVAHYNTKMRSSVLG
jgi:hypothetical protein